MCLLQTARTRRAEAGGVDFFIVPAHSAWCRYGSKHDRRAVRAFVYQRAFWRSVLVVVASSVRCSESVAGACVVILCLLNQEVSNVVCSTYCSPFRRKQICLVVGRTTATRRAARLATLTRKVAPRCPFSVFQKMILDESSGRGTSVAQIKHWTTTALYARYTSSGASPSAITSMSWSSVFLAEGHV